MSHRQVSFTTSLAGSSARGWRLRIAGDDRAGAAWPEEQGGARECECSGPSGQRWRPCVEGSSLLRRRVDRDYCRSCAKKQQHGPNAAIGHVSYPDIAKIGERRRKRHPRERMVA